MAVFSVFEPPPGDMDAEDHAARFVFVRDGFHWAAFLFGPLWMLRYRLWLAFVLYALAVAATMFVASRMGLPPAVLSATSFVLAIFIGVEAGSLRRWKLRRAKWREHGVVVADTKQAAERRFFDRWFDGGGMQTAPPAPPHRPIRITPSRHMPRRGSSARSPSLEGTGDRCHRRLWLRQSPLRCESL